MARWREEEEVVFECGGECECVWCFKVNESELDGRFMGSCTFLASVALMRDVGCQGKLVVSSEAGSLVFDRRKGDDDQPSFCPPLLFPAP
jgi:hypothetical protein